MTASKLRSVWLDWQPQSQILAGHVKNEPPKPPKSDSEGFAGSLFEYSPTSAASPDATRWMRDFHFWVLERCCFAGGYWSPVEDLHSDFCKWGGGTRNCSPEDFEALIEVEVYIETHGSIVWCYGLVLSRLLLPELAEAWRPRLLVDGILEIDPVGDD